MEEIWGLMCDKVSPGPCGVETKMLGFELGLRAPSGPSASVGHSFSLIRSHRFPKSQSLNPTVLSKAVLRLECPGPEETWLCL